MKDALDQLDTLINQLNQDTTDPAQSLQLYEAIIAQSKAILDDLSAYNNTVQVLHSQADTLLDDQ